MKIDAAVYRYIEHELYNYQRYKKELELERQAILDSSPLPPDGQPRGTVLSNPTEKKAIALWSNIGIVALQRSINAIEQTYSELDEEHRKVFIEVYEKKRKDWYWIGRDLGMAERTIMRKKSNIVMLAGKNLGIIRR